MTCEHRCLGCTRNIPLPHEVVTLNGIIYYHTLPACHANADLHALVPGTPPDRPCTANKKVKENSLNELVSGNS